MGVWGIESQCISQYITVYSSRRNLKYCSGKFFPCLTNSQNHLEAVKKKYKFPGPILKGGIQEPVEAASEKAAVLNH